jgi:hypothetical protein
MRSSATYGDFAVVPILPSMLLRAIPMATSHFAIFSSFPGAFGRFTRTVPPSTPSAHFSESSRKFTGANITSAMPRPSASSAFSVRLFFSGFSTITRSAFSMPIRFGSRYAPPHAGTMPRNTSGSAMAGAEASRVR